MTIVTLLKLTDGEYKDQYGFSHRCKVVIDSVELTPTGETENYEYYTETVEDPIYQAPDGRLFRCHIPTDFGCRSSWTEYPGSWQEGVRWVELYERNKGKPVYYVDIPVIDRRNEPNEENCNLLTEE